MFNIRLLQSFQKYVNSTIASLSNAKELTTKGELRMQNILKKKFPNAILINVTDISGGCGSMYRIFVESPEFKGKTKVQQHKLITDALANEFISLHGLVIKTQVPIFPSS